MKIHLAVIFPVLFVALALGVIAVSCKDGEDGSDGSDGEVIEVNIDDDSADDDADDDHDDDADDDADDDDDSDEVLDRDDLDYADECPALADCVIGACNGSVDPDSYYQVAQCALSNCRDDYENCFGGFGGQACVYIMKCLQQCLPADCIDECIDGASYEAMLLFMDAGVCVEDNCPSAFEDPLANMGCFMGACNDPIAQCCGGTLLGCM